MRILLANNHHSIGGGAEQYYFSLANLLKSKGHRIAFFSMKSKYSEKTEWSKYFVSQIDFNDNSLKSYVKIFLRMFYSMEAKRKIGKLLDNFKPDIVHINNIYYYISPSILREINKRGIPIVQTVHDFQLISPNLNLYSRGQICENTKVNRYYKAVLNRDIKGSLLASLMATITSYTQHWFRFYENNISVFITPSLFMKNKLIEYGFNSKTLVHLPNFVPLIKNNTCTSKDDGYVLYFGRLTDHKGLSDLLWVVKGLPQVKFMIVGGFSDKEILTEINKYLRSNPHGNLKVLDHQNQNDLRKLILNCSFVVVPSRWYENQPYSILETYALGKPVIASNIGGIPEIVLQGKTGYLFKPGDKRDLANKILELWNNKYDRLRMGKYAKIYVIKNFSPKEYYKKLSKIYKNVK